MKNEFKLLLQFVAIFICSVSSVHAAVVVYTDPIDWETAVMAFPDNWEIQSDNFELLQTGNLSTGYNPFGYSSSSLLASGLYISGDPGVNSIDDSFSPDPFSDALSPNGTTYYLGQVQTPTVDPSLNVFIMDSNIRAFGADWVTFGDLFMEFGGGSISFSDYLPTGTGFLGVISDIGQGESADINFFGTAAFGMDDIRVSANHVPIPAAVWLFGSGLLGLFGVARHKK